MISKLLIAVHALPMCMLTSILVDEILLPRYMKCSNIATEKKNFFFSKHKFACFSFRRLWFFFFCRTAFITSSSFSSWFFAQPQKWFLASMQTGSKFSRLFSWRYETLPSSSYLIYCIWQLIRPFFFPKK